VLQHALAASVIEVFAAAAGDAANSFDDLAVRHVVHPQLLLGQMDFGEVGVAVVAG
jgi:hypothetical protein